MSARVFTGNQQVDALPANDRGLAYGDGVFETMRVHDGRVPWWDAHWSRLTRGAARLGIPLPDESVVRDHASQLSGDDGVIKLIVTRGGGGRGYAPGSRVEPNWQLSRHPGPAKPASDGLAVRWCDLRLALQPALAGIKHCNRLEQVMARGEWRDDAIDEGLMCDSEGFAVCATSANLFVLRDDAWLTPAVDRCGVAGVCRAWSMAALAARETRLTVEAVESADAVFLCNAVRGILPVARLDGRTWRPNAQVAALRSRLALVHPAFAADLEVS